MGISLGMVGLGSFGSQFAPLFNAHPAVNRIGLCDREPERIRRWAEDEAFQEKFNPSDTYSSLEEACDSDLDALVLITQPWLHAEQAIRAMRAGKHVYSAVPVVSVPDADEILDWCDQLVRTVQRTGRHYMLGETTYYRPEAMYCRRRAAEGAFGRFVHTEGHYFHDVDDPGCNLRQVRRQRLSSEPGQQWRRTAEQYSERGVVGGPMTYPTHSVAGPLCVTGAHVLEGCCWGQKDESSDDYFSGRLMNETALFRLSNGATMRICEYRRIGHPGEEIFRVFGTEGSFREGDWVTKEERTPLTVQQMRDLLPDPVKAAFQGGLGEGFYGGHGGSHAYLVHEFVSAIAEDRTPAVSVWDAVRYMAPGAVAHKSALADGELMKVPDWGDPPKA